MGCGGGAGWPGGFGGGMEGCPGGFGGGMPGWPGAFGGGVGFSGGAGRSKGVLLVWAGEPGGFIGAATADRLSPPMMVRMGMMFFIPDI